jgi:hypothetical protein
MTISEKIQKFKDKNLTDNSTFETKHNMLYVYLSTISSVILLLTIAIYGKKYITNPIFNTIDILTE